MEWHNLLHALISLLFVIGLLLLTLWFIQVCRQKGLNCRLIKKLKAGQRLEIMETLRIDARNTLVLFRRDDREHLILLGTSSNLMIENDINKPQGLTVND